MTDVRALVAASLEESVRVKEAVRDGLADHVAAAAERLVAALTSGGKLLVCGNGGSAADAQHVAAELIGRLEHDRAALPAIALTTDTSVLTSLANDLGVEAIFARQVEALARPGDVLLALSTSGRSPNVLAAVEAARAAGVTTIALTGADGDELADVCDLAIRVPSRRTMRIQEAHIAICHALCESVESSVVGA